MKKIIFVAALLMVSKIANAIDVEGLIDDLFVGADGSVGVRLSISYDSVASACPTHNGWAGIRGNTDESKMLKAAIFSAHARKSEVRLTMDGCADTWLNVINMYELK